MIPKPLERLRSIHPIQDVWFKKRTVFEATREAYEHRELDHEEYYVDRYPETQILSDFDDDAKEFLERHTGPQSTANRLKNDDCTLFLARTEEDGSPAGFYWSVVADSEPVWHDSFKLQVGNALVFNAYVAESHRRRGVYRLLQGAAHNHLFVNTGCEAVITIVENQNTASIQANREFGLQPTADNYLLKILSVNVLSVVKNDITRTLFVLRRGGL